MPQHPAPYFADVAEGPDCAEAFWATCADGVRIRLGLWPLAGARGTVLIFPGRTEYIEKYGRTAAELHARGYAVAALDWRGQGLADRLIADRSSGHVGKFRDYQQDVAALLELARARGLPEPFHLLGHSMGGCIGLRALLEGLPMRSAAFSSPMWGILIAPSLRPVAWVLGWAARRVGQGHRYAPGTRPENFLEINAFDGNTLTSDREMWDYMARQIRTHPELGIGGPSLQWLNEAMMEVRELARAPSPDLPAITFLGSNERIVDAAPIRERMARWPKGRLELVQGAEHEVLMEKPAIRAHVLAEMDGLFRAAS